MQVLHLICILINCLNGVCGISSLELSQYLYTFPQTLECLGVEKHLQDLPSWLRNRAYPTWLIEKEFRRVREYNIQEDTSTLVKSCKKGVPFTITFHPSLKHSFLAIKKNLYILYLDTQARKVFTPEPFIAFCSCSRVGELTFDGLGSVLIGNSYLCNLCNVYLKYFGCNVQSEHVHLQLAQIF